MPFITGIIRSRSTTQGFEAASSSSRASAPFSAPTTS